MTDARRPRRSREKTALAIEHAAIDLVNAHGYDHVTVDMICAEAQVSQRTFFNYFKTKDAALLGRAVPEIDDDRVSTFVASDGPLMVEAMEVIRVDPALARSEETLFAQRIRAISSNPELLARQMERLAAIESELRSAIVARLRRQGETGDLDAEADLITNLLAGVMRYRGQAMARRLESTEASGAPDFAALLASVLAKLG